MSPILKFTKYVSSGKKKGTQLFLGLIELLVDSETAAEKGKKLTGLQYLPELQSFTINLFGHSPSAYKYIADKIHLPSIHQLLWVCIASREWWKLIATHRNIQSWETLFAVGSASKDVLCALAADDMKLTAALCPYQDPKDKRFYVVGVAGHPIEVANPDELKEILEQGGHKLADKVLAHILCPISVTDWL